MPEGFPYPVKNGRDAADAADRLRVIWRLGINPVKSLTDLLEELGIKVGMVPGAPGFDGAAFETDDDVTLPLIIVNRNLSGEDQRFALARELSYFFLNGANAQLANHFAASFLVPTDALLKDLGRQRDNIEIYEIFMLKQKYGISMRRLFTRAASLRIISGSELEEWMELFEEMGWKDAEPGGPYPPEISRRILMLVLRLQAEGQITEERAAEMLGVPAEYWDDLLHFRPLRDIEAEEESDEETVAEEEGEEGDEEPIAEESAEGEE
jgi:Zn-dependent peptidase ImmA (M78 family)